MNAHDNAQHDAPGGAHGQEHGDVDLGKVPPIRTCGAVRAGAPNQPCTLPPGHGHLVHQTATSAQWPAPDGGRIPEGLYDDPLAVYAGHDLDWHAHLYDPVRGRLGYVVGGADVDWNPVAATDELAAHGWAVVGGAGGWRETGPEERWQWVAAVRACAPAARPHGEEDAPVSIADDLARYLPAPGGERAVHADTGDTGEHDEDQEHGDVDGADALGWSIVPAGLAGALREVVERHLPPGRAAEAGVDPQALVWDLAVAAETWQTGAAPYRAGVVL